VTLDVEQRHPVVHEPSLIPLGSGRGVTLITATVFASMARFLDASVVNVAVPAIGPDFGASLVALRWTLTGYLLTATALLLVSGALADRWSAPHAPALAPDLERRYEHPSTSRD
jgi:MFS family permease